MIALLLLAAISYTLHPKDIFQPPKPPDPAVWAAPEDHRRAVEIPLSEGFKLRGWLYQADAPNAPYVLFFYGSNEDLAHEANRLAWLRDTLHVNAICFDYPGYGFSQGAIDVQAIRSAALQEVDFIRSTLATKDEPIVSYGWSIGTAMAIHAAAERPVNGLILQAPMASAKEMTQQSSRHDVPWYGRGIVTIKADPVVQQLYDGAAAIQQIKTPLLVIQGQLDEVVTLQQGKEVFAASPSHQKQFVEVPGAHHNDLHFKDPPAAGALADFLRLLSTSHTPQP